MIVVAIIGILAAIAIPNFLRYQLRSKLSELKTNVEAISKSEESLRQSERILCAGASTGAYVAFAAIPTGKTVNAQRLAWAAPDNLLASTIDWSVQGNTYGQYQAATASAPTSGATCAAPVGIGAFGYALSISAVSDLDGDATLATVGFWSPQMNSADGTVKTPAPSLPLVGDTTVCGGAAPGTNQQNTPLNCSSDNVF
jgi:type IV pilus assembly protein PilA